MPRAIIIAGNNDLVVVCKVSHVSWVRALGKYMYQHLIINNCIYYYRQIMEFLIKLWFLIMQTIVLFIIYLIHEVEALIGLQVNLFTLIGVIRTTLNRLL